jgi:hypothetical protein
VGVVKETARYLWCCKECDGDKYCWVWYDNRTGDLVRLRGLQNETDKESLEVQVY